MNGEHINAVAGPSNLKPLSPPQSSSTPHLFFPPPEPRSARSSYLSSTEDLLARFSLLPAYDRYVRPYIAPPDMGATTLPQGIGAPSALEKGKGKEVVGTPAHVGPLDAGEGDDDDGTGAKGEKKRKNTYKHLIKSVPGKHSLKKDDYLTTIMEVPPKQRMRITPFDQKTQHEAFTVSLEGLKGWNVNALILESAQAREDRKKRKELKRLAKLQQQVQAQAALPSNVAQPLPVKASMHSVNPSAMRVASTSIPTAGTPRPGSTVPRSISDSQRPSLTSTVSMQMSNQIPRPLPTMARPGSTVPSMPPTQLPTARVATPLRAGAATPSTPVRVAGAVPLAGALPPPYAQAADQDKRGLKRERDETVFGPGPIANGVGNHNGMITMHPAASNVSNIPRPILNAKAGVAGARPRPIKKQRMDIQGQARDVITQQPTPQGV